MNAVAMFTTVLSLLVPLTGPGQETSEENGRFPLCGGAFVSFVPVGESGYYEIKFDDGVVIHVELAKTGSTVPYVVKLREPENGQ